MKMLPCHYNRLKKAIVALPPIPRRTYNDAAYRWHLFYLAGIHKSLLFHFIYSFYNDNHIDTALRKIVLGTSGFPRGEIRK